MSRRRIIQTAMVLLVCFNLGTVFEEYIQPYWLSLSTHRGVGERLLVVTETGERISSLFEGAKAPAGVKPRPVKPRKVCTPNSMVGAISRILSTAFVTTVSAQACQGNYFTTQSYSCGLGGDCVGQYYDQAYSDSLLASWCDGYMNSYPGACNVGSCPPQGEDAICDSCQ